MDQNQVCELLQQAVLDFCQQNMSSWSSDIEVDGIICISPKNSADHHVVKIHEKLQKVFLDEGRTAILQQQDVNVRNANSLGMDVCFEQGGEDASQTDIVNKTITCEKSRDITSSAAHVMNGDVAIVNLENSVVGDNVYLHSYNKDSNETTSHFDSHSKNRRKQARKSPPTQILPKSYSNTRNSDLESNYVPSTPDVFQIGNQHNEDINQDWSITKNTSTEFVEEPPVIKKETAEFMNCDSQGAQSDYTNFMHNNSRPILPLSIVQTTNSSRFSGINRELEHSCKFCGKQFSFKCTKVRHERNSCGKNIQTLYSCEMCEKVFSRSDSRVRHMIKAHGMAPLNSVTRKTKQPEIQEQ